MSGKNVLSAQKKLALKVFLADFNFGDLLGLSICQKLSPTTQFKPIKPYEDASEPNILSIGSMLKGADVNSTIWGSGFIASYEYLQSKPKQVVAVRGPLTNDKIQQQGLQPVKVMGDPACLVGRFYGDRVKVKYKYGLLPHYVDKSDYRIQQAGLCDDVLLIDPQQQPEVVINQIKQCQYILSSSLHGLICADALEIPAVYLKLADRLSGDGFKFVDYFLSCGRQDHRPYEPEDEINFSRALKKAENFKFKVNLDDLIDAFPLN